MIGPAQQSAIEEGCMAKDKKSATMKYLERIRGGPLTFGALVRSIRETDEHTLEDLAKRLGVSRSHLRDIEKGRRAVSAGIKLKIEVQTA
jgi:DNA-binding XRE family transcriptional regulator